MVLHIIRADILLNTTQVAKYPRVLVMVMVMVFIYRIFYMIYSNAVYMRKGEIGHQHI